MSVTADYTLFYNPQEGKLHAGSCREENELLVDITIGDEVEIPGCRGEGNNLILNGMDFTTTADIALVVPGGVTIVLEDGNNILKVLAQGPESNVAALYSQGNLTISGGAGKLLCDTTSTNETNCSWSRGICARYGDLTITGGYVEAICGKCAVRAGAIYAGGRLFGGENQNGAITITGGTVVGFSVPHTIRATNDRLTIGPHSIVENSGEFSGSDAEWHGSYLLHADMTKPVIVKFKS